MALSKNGFRGKPPDNGNRQNNAPPGNGPGDTGKPPVSGEIQAVADWLRKVKFRRTLIGGLDERSVWNKIKELNALYEEALRAERIRYDTLLEEYRRRSGQADGDEGVSVLTQDGHKRQTESG